jgi:hypothetical protein
METFSLPSGAAILLGIRDQVSKQKTYEFKDSVKDDKMLKTANITFVGSRTYSAWRTS